MCQYFDYQTGAVTNINLINWSSAPLYKQTLTQRRKDISNDLKEAIVAAINVEFLRMWLPNYVESVILQRERLFTSGKYSRQLSIFQGMNVPASSPQGQTVQCSERLQKTQELHLRLYEPQLAAKTRLKLGHQQDNDPKHSSTSTAECLKKKGMKVLQWSSQSPAWLKCCGWTNVNKPQWTQVLL